MYCGRSICTVVGPLAFLLLDLYLIFRMNLNSSELTSLRQCHYSKILKVNYRITYYEV